MSKLTAIVVSEPDGGVVRVIIVPSSILKYNETDEVTGEDDVVELADYGNQEVNFINPDECQTMAEVQAIFDKMNPPDSDVNEEP